MADVEHMLNSVGFNFSENHVHFDTVVAVYREMSLLASEKPSSVQSIISQINTALNTSKTRLDGLVLLHEVVLQCSTTVFTQNAIPWMQSVLQIAQGFCPSAIQTATCYVFKQLITHTANFPELARDVSSTYLAQVIQCLVNTGQQSLCTALECLETCIQCFPSGCGPHKGKIETLVLSLLENSQPKVQEAAIRVLTLLPRCGGSGNVGVKYTEAWSVQCSKIMGSLQETLGDLYEGVEMGAHSEVETSTKLSLLPVSGNKFDCLSHLSKRYEMLCSCVEQLLSQDFPASSKIPVNSLLDIVCRALAVTRKILVSRPSTDRLQLSSVIPFVHAASFKVLSALIISCKSNLIPYTSTVNKLFSQTLSWSKPEVNMYGKERLYSSLRKQVYSTLSDWAQVLRLACDVHTTFEQLWPHIMADIQPEADTVKIQPTASKPDDGPPSKKKKKKSATSKLSDTFSSHRKINMEANSQVCHAALKALRHILYTAGGQLRSIFHKDMQNTVILLLLEIQRSLPSALPIPYSDPKCRQELYRVLLALCIAPSPRWPPPTQSAVKLFSSGLRDGNLEVSSFCQEALMTCETLIHPRAYSLQAPIQVAEIISDPKNNNVKQTGETTCSGATADQTAVIRGSSLLMASFSKFDPVPSTSGEPSAINSKQSCSIQDGANKSESTSRNIPEEQSEESETGDESDRETESADPPITDSDKTNGEIIPENSNKSKNLDQDSEVMSSSNGQDSMLSHIYTVVEKAVEEEDNTATSSKDAVCQMESSDRKRKLSEDDDDDQLEDMLSCFVDKEAEADAGGS